MKPEHFLYKSDDLYYMQNVPISASYCDCKYCIKATERRYTEALERAKAEAVPFNDYFLGLKRILHSMNISCGEGNEDLVRVAKSHLKEGEIYTINMEEKIEVVEEPELPGFDHTSYPTFIKFARIAAPKKKEETQEQIWREAIEDIVDPRTAFEKGKNIDYLMTKFEIKRKPL